MARKNQLQAKLDEAMKEASRAIMLRAVESMPRDITMGEFIDAMDGTDFASEFRALDLDAFQSALGAAPAPRRGRPAGRKKAATKKSAGKKGHNTRTQAGREALDAAIADCLKEAGGPIRSEVIKATTGATPNQIRQALARLDEAGKVKKTGQKRATEYRWKGRK